MALRALFRQNNPEILEENFHPFTLDHRTQATLNKFKFFWFKALGLAELHKVVVLPPADDSQPHMRPADHARTLLSYRAKLLHGTGPLDFLGDVLEAWAPQIGNFTTDPGFNPANSFLGAGQWTSVSAEAEITPGTHWSPLAKIEHTWSGWSISQDKFLKIISGIENRVKGLDLPRPLVRREVFTNMKNLQLYDVTSQLIIYDSGIQKLNDVLFPKGGAAELRQRLIDIESSKSHKFLCVESSSSSKPALDCLRPWMHRLFALRGHPGKAPEERLKWIAQLVRHLEKSLPLKTFLSLLSQEDYFFQVRVGGFRTHEENQDMDYVSDSIGQSSPEKGSGIFEEFSSKYKIISHELKARYLSDGF